LSQQMVLALPACHNGFTDRCELWRVAAYLAAVQVMGTSQIGYVVRAVGGYL
jgi:hypothetical protein